MSLLLAWTSGFIIGAVVGIIYILWAQDLRRG